MTSWNSSSRDATNARTFGRSVWRIMASSDVPACRDPLDTRLGSYPEVPRLGENILCVLGFKPVFIALIQTVLK